MRRIEWPGSITNEANGHMLIRCAQKRPVRSCESGTVDVLSRRFEPSSAYAWLVDAANVDENSRTIFLPPATGATAGTAAGTIMGACCIPAAACAADMGLGVPACAGVAVGAATV